MMHRTLRAVTLTVPFAIVYSSIAVAQPPAKVAAPPAAVKKETTKVDAAREADREAIRQTSLAFIKAFDEGNAKAIAAGWTVDGEYHGENGETIRGRDKIEHAYLAIMDGKSKSRLDIDIESIRFLSKDAAIEEGILRQTPAGTGLPTSNHYRVIHVREDGQWKTAVVQEWAAGETRLDDIAWLLGDWASGAGDYELAMSFSWNDKKSVIRNHFTMKEKDKVVSMGTQSIVLDKQTNRIRSWMFDEEGGRGDSIWSRDGNRWVLEAVGVLPDGSDTTALNVITRNGNDELVWRSTNRTINGNRAPDSEPIKLTRTKAAK